MTARGTLGRIGMMSPVSMEEITQESDIMPRAMEALKLAGITPPQNPRGNYDGSLRVKIINLDDNQLGDLLQQIDSYCSFVEFELSKASNARDDALKDYENIKARVSLLIKDNLTEKVSVSDKADMVTTDPRVYAAGKHYSYCEAVFTLVKTIAHNAQRDWDTVSRRITQRGQEVERAKRESNVAGIPNPSFNFRRSNR